MSHPTYVFGSHQIEGFSKSDLQALLDILKSRGIKHIDTARVYGDSEKCLGEVKAAQSFTIDTKSPAFVPKALSGASLADGIQKSLSLLGTAKVDTYYLHAPDNDTPIEETVDAIQALHRQGKFERFGLSNFLPEDVRKIHAYAQSKGGVVPSVYQGNYNAFARTIEDNLFPLLRELGIAFYAYSPLAGGFFAKRPDDLESKKAEGRFDPSTISGQMYNTLYTKPTTIAALRHWNQIAEHAGDSSVNLAYRWAVFNSKLDAGLGDAVILGASRPAQLENTLSALDAGPLKPETVDQIEKLWKLIEKDAPLDNYHSFAKEFM
ncbi:NADP-dependent oxidoreductase domain-containing protein [Boeremia exigua]|uniref:NADP-dependent oxidoreductase domain-containing protein n=1 Tax=Boeremia exigua TaxID=749465 RepID=UPI001E8E0B1E|nr:NADP-dependent oxidoreductase domain-containing protein [Boeremia exigua]KAH6611689.1 NADP-dependent oxidoreductase domain-containing protein [Boeremia exigua]